VNTHIYIHIHIFFSPSFVCVNTLTWKSLGKVCTSFRLSPIGHDVWREKLKYNCNAGCHSLVLPLISVSTASTLRSMIAKKMTVEST